MAGSFIFVRKRWKVDSFEATKNVIHSKEVGETPQLPQEQEGIGRTRRRGGGGGRRTIADRLCHTGY